MANGVFPTGFLPYPATPILDNDIIWDYHIYNLYDEFSGVETTLGTGVQGSYATVRQRLEAIEGVEASGNYLNRAGGTMFGDITPLTSGLYSVGTTALPFAAVAAGSLFSNTIIGMPGFATLGILAGQAGQTISILFPDGIIFYGNTTMYPAGDYSNNFGTPTANWATGYFGDVISSGVKLTNFTGGPITLDLTPTSSGTLGIGTLALPFSSGYIKSFYTDKITASSQLTIVSITSGVVLSSGTSLYPEISGAQFLGSTSKRFSGIFTNTINSGLVLNQVFMEEPVGTVNGINSGFSLGHAPYGSSLMLFMNGLLMLPAGAHSTTADYTLVTTGITFFVPPASGSTLIAASYGYQG